MLEALDRGSLAEVTRAMALDVQTQPRAKERRIRELGFLASLVNGVELPSHLTFAVVERQLYDHTRPESAPHSRQLVERYGSWRRACYHAYGLLPDGRWRGPGQPWPSAVRGKLMPPDYERYEVREALRECAFALCVRPTSTTFSRWLAAKRLRARARGLTLRLPSLRSLYRHYPANSGGYNAALADAEILDEELDEAWHSRLGVDDPEALTPDEFINGMTTGELMAAGLSNQTARLLKQRSLRKTRGKVAPNRAFSASDVAEGLPLSDGLRVAAWIGASLGWLAGLTKQIGAPPDPALVEAGRLDTEAVRAQRIELGLADAAVRKALGIHLGPYRRLMKGQREPNLHEMVLLARLLRAPMDSLMRVD